MNASLVHKKITDINPDEYQQISVLDLSFNIIIDTNNILKLKNLTILNLTGNQIRLINTIDLPNLEILILHLWKFKTPIYL
jgi:Leucine-rich repeat (LRR) protein